MFFVLDTGKTAGVSASLFEGGGNKETGHCHWERQCLAFITT